MISAYNYLVNKMGGYSEEGESSDCQSLEAKIELKKQSAKDKGIYLKAYEILLKYGSNIGGHTSMYEEREITGKKFLGLLTTSRRKFAITYDEYTDAICDIHTRYLSIFKEDRVVFHTSAKDWVPTVFGRNEPVIDIYTDNADWESHLDELFLHGPRHKQKQEELRKNFNL